MAGLRQALPIDGLPVLDDWITVLEGMIFAGLDLVREPIDVTVLISILGVFTFLSMENGEYVYIFFALLR